MLSVILRRKSQHLFEILGIRGQIRNQKKGVKFKIVNKALLKLKVFRVFKVSTLTMK